MIYNDNSKNKNFLSIDTSIYKSILPVSKKLKYSSKNNSCVYNAFKKNDLGTIPSDVSKILYFDKKAEPIKGFGSASERFKEIKDVNGSIFKDNEVLSDISSEISKEDRSTLNNSTVIKNKNKSVNKNSERFSSIYNKDSKYLPGPAEYSTNIMNIGYSNKNNYRYNSLFNSESNRNYGNYLNINNNSNLGPGHYDLKVCNFLSSSINPKVYISITGRNLNLSSNQTKSHVGPGSYRPKKSLVEDLDLKNPSFFFREKSNKGGLNAEKYIRTETKNYQKLTGEHLGPCDFCEDKNNIKANHKDIKKDWMFRTKLLINNTEENKKEKNKQNYIFNPFKKASFEELFGKRKIGISIDSKVHKKEFTGNHVPGPCYYFDEELGKNYGKDRNEYRKAVLRNEQKLKENHKNMKEYLNLSDGNIKFKDMLLK